jgi:hypothetical protein
MSRPSPGTALATLDAVVVVLARNAAQRSGLRGRRSPHPGDVTRHTVGQGARSRLSPAEVDRKHAAI